jgi:hypothetical protein
MGPFAVAAATSAALDSYNGDHSGDRPQMSNAPLSPRHCPPGLYTAKFENRVVSALPRDQENFKLHFEEIERAAG